MPSFRLLVRATLFAVLTLTGTRPAVLAAQPRITTPKEALGANFGDDYFLANYTQLSGYWRTLEKESDRLKLVEIGKTAEGRPHLMAIVTSPDNHKRLARLKDISSRLAHAEGLTDDQARALAKEGRTVVWIDGGLHATETLGAQQLGEMVYQMVSRTDEETLRFLDDCVILFVHANPDGNELVANWYMRNSVPTERTLANLPRLYQKYIGHDNNRDFFASTQVETENMNRVMFRDWYPQLLYNHHQSGPAGTVVYSPPLRDPYNFNLHPALILGLQSLGAAMHTRLVVENKPGATMRSGGPYDGWWNGGLRNTATFHNTIAMLTEMIGSPTPMRIPFVAARQVPGGDLAMPIAPQEWHLRQSVDYSVSLNRAVLDYASRLRENTLYNFYSMGKTSIERGNRDTWTANPRRISEVTGQPIFTSGGAVTAGGTGAGGRGGAAPPNDADIWARIRAPELRDPRGFIIPSNQRDFPTAVKFVNALLETGITVQRATREFTVAGKSYPAGSYVVPTAQAFRPHVIDMFEPQRHPDVFPYPGSPPTPPYDNAGWTLAFQMGVEFDRILESFSGQFEPVTEWNAKPPAGSVIATSGASGFLISNRTIDTFRAANQLMAGGDDVSRLTSSLTGNGHEYPAGSLYIRARPTTRARIASIATALGVNFEGVRTSVPKDARKLNAARVGLWDVYGGSMPSGWTRWILEQFDFPFARVFAPALDAGSLNASYDLLVFPTGAIPGERGGRGGGGGGLAEAMPANLPAEFAGQPGRITPDRTIPKLREFVENGGTIVAIGSSAANLAAAFKLPIENKLAENGTPLPRTKFYVPGSLLTARVDISNPYAQGVTERVDMFFDDSPAFALGPQAAAAGVTRIAWFDSKASLHSGWAWGQEYLENGAAAVEAKIGKGRVLLFGPEILQRAQPHGTFRFLFNTIQLSGK
ncbi:MAG: peptidase [Gemmatimonadaceae bacterium]|nr:peptidase [Gemmatimonadaceae bacterium]